MEIEMIFAALSDRTRLRLLNLMRDGEVCVCFFAEAVGTNNPKISRHLSYLKRAGLVSVRRDGKWAHYSIKKPSSKPLADLLDRTLELISHEKDMKADIRKLEKMTCDPNALVSIKRG